MYMCMYSRRQKNAPFSSRSVPFSPFFIRSVCFRPFNSGHARLEARLGRVLTAPHAYTSTMYAQDLCLNAGGGGTTCTFLGC